MNTVTVTMSISDFDVMRIKVKAFENLADFYMDIKTETQLARDVVARETTAMEFVTLEKHQSDDLLLQIKNTIKRENNRIAAVQR